MVRKCGGGFNIFSFIALPMEEGRGKARRMLFRGLAMPRETGL